MTAEEKNQAEKYGWIIYMYSFMRNMNEEHQKAFMKALLYFHDDIEANWNIYRSVFEFIRNQLQEVAHQCGHYLGDIKEQKQNMPDMEIGYYIANIVKATHGRGNEDEFTKLMYVNREHLDKLSREYVLEEGKRIEHALITAAERLGWERLPTLAEIKRRFNETGDGPD